MMAICSATSSSQILCSSASGQCLFMLSHDLNDEETWPTECSVMFLNVEGDCSRVQKTPLSTYIAQQFGLKVCSFLFCPSYYFTLSSILHTPLR